MHPPVFSDLSFDDAMSAKDKLVLVDATASWCMPCKHMDKTTWVDAKVVDAIGKHGLAIQFDVDEHKELAKKLGVRAMPTVIAFRDGKEIDRIVGMRAPADLVAWLDGLARGETSLDIARKAARDNPTNADARLALARGLLQAGVLDEATTEHVWIWEHILEHAPQFVGVKHSFFLQQLQQLVKGHAPAREAFTRLRDAAAPGTIDWFSLNKALGDDAATLAWFDTVKDKLKDDEELAKSVEGAVIPMLVAAGRWVDAGKAFVHPLKTLERIAERNKQTTELAKQLPPEQATQALAEFQKMNVRDVSTLRRALFEAGRDEDLKAVEEAAKKVDPAWVEPSAK
jgi:thiol-disulfide isomerase/thioredoxin